MGIFCKQKVISKNLKISAVLVYFYDTRPEIEQRYSKNDFYLTENGHDLDDKGGMLKVKLSQSRAILFIKRQNISLGRKKKTN